MTGLTDPEARRLGLLRIAVFGIWAVIAAGTDLDLYARLPAELFQPKGLARVLPIDALVASPVALTTLRLAVVAGCLACVAGLRPYRPIAAATAVLVFVFDSAMKSLGGYANHAQIIPLLLAAIVAMFPAADAWRIGRKQAESRDPWEYRLGLLGASATVTILYAFIGARRIMVGAVDIYRDDSLLLWIAARTSEYSAIGLDGGATLLEHAWLLPVVAAGMLVTTVFECLSPLALVHDRFRVAWLSAIVAFHIATLLTMNIFFWENIVLVAVLFTSLPDHLSRLTRREDQEPLRSRATFRADRPGMSR